MSEHDPTDTPAATRTSRIPTWTKLVLVSACLFQLGLGLVWSVLVPPFRGLDERAHVAAVLQLVYHDTWPDPAGLAITQGLVNADAAEQPATFKAPPSPTPRGERKSLAALGGSAPTVLRSQMSQHPPLGYVAQATVVRLDFGSHRLAADQVLALMRWVSALLLAAVPFLAYATMRRFTRDRWLLSAAALTPLLLPGIARAGGTVSNDPLQILLTSALIYALARIATGDRSVRGGVLVGVVTLLDLLTKGTALVAPILLLAAYGWSWWRSRAGTGEERGRLGRSAIWATAGTVLGSVWWVRNAVEFGAVQPLGGDVTNPPVMHAHDYWTFVRTFFSAISFRFWGSLGSPEPPALDRGLTIVATSVTLALIAVGLVMGARHRQLVAMLIGLAAFVGVLAIVSLGSLSYYLRYAMFSDLQGRYLYPVAIALTPPALLGLGALLRGLARPLVPVTVLLFVALLQASAARDALRASWTPGGHSLADGLHVLLQWAPFPPSVTYAMLGFGLLAGAVLAAAVVVPTLATLGRGMLGRQPTTEAA